MKNMFCFFSSEIGELFGLSTRCKGQNSYLAQVRTALGSVMPPRLCLWEAITSESRLQTPPTNVQFRVASVCWHLVNHVAKEEETSNCSRFNIVKYYKNISEIYAVTLLMYQITIIIIRLLIFQIIVLVYSCKIMYHFSWYPYKPMTTSDVLNFDMLSSLVNDSNRKRPLEFSKLNTK